MSETATLRATSLLASAGLLGGAVILALTFTYAVPEFELFTSRPVITTAVQEPPPIPPAPTPRHQPLSPPTDAEPMDTILPADMGTTPLEIADFGVPAPYATPQITDPHWLRRPRNLQRYYPRTAIARGIEGTVELDCLVAITGDLRCAVISETPREWGFGAAALRIAAEHRMEPAQRDGAPVEGRYRMRVPFRAE